MQQKPVAGDLLETTDGNLGVVRLWRVVEMRYYAELDRMIPMVVLVYEESISDHAAMAR
jgi:hypothetical protein